MQFFAMQFLSCPLEIEKKTLDIFTLQYQHLWLLILWVVVLIFFLVLFCSFKNSYQSCIQSTNGYQKIHLLNSYLLNIYHGPDIMPILKTQWSTQDKNFLTLRVYL